MWFELVNEWKLYVKIEINIQYIHRRSDFHIFITCKKPFENWCTESPRHEFELYISTIVEQCLLFFITFPLQSNLIYLSIYHNIQRDKSIYIHRRWNIYRKGHSKWLRYHRTFFASYLVHNQFRCFVLYLDKKILIFRQVRMQSTFNIIHYCSIIDMHSHMILVFTITFISYHMVG